MGTTTAVAESGASGTRPVRSWRVGILACTYSITTDWGFQAHNPRGRGTPGQQIQVGSFVGSQPSRWVAYNTTSTAAMPTAKPRKTSSNARPASVSVPTLTLPVA